MNVQSLPDITPNGATVPLSTDPNIAATFVSVMASATGARVGGPTCGPNEGLLLTDDKYDFYPPNYDQGLYYLSKIFVYAPAGTTKISVIYG